MSNGGRTESDERSLAESGWLRAPGPGAPRPASRRRAPRRPPRSSHLAAPRPGAGGWLVPGLSSSSSSLSREGLRGAKNREKLCQGAPPLLRPPDISPARQPVRGRSRGTRETVSCALRPAPRDPARAGLTRRGRAARLRPSRAGEARALCAPSAATSRAVRRLLLLPPARPPPGGARGRGTAPIPGPAAVRHRRPGPRCRRWPETRRDAQPRYAGLWASRPNGLQPVCLFAQIFLPITDLFFYPPANGRNSFQTFARSS